MNMFNFSWDEFFCFVILLFRSGGILQGMPFLGGKIVPTQVKIFLSLILAFILTPVVTIRISSHIPNHFSLIWLAITEILIGLIIGYAAKLIFEGIQLSGQLVGFQIGLAVANVMDPQTQNQISLFAQMEYMVALLIFLSLNAHHIFIEAIVKSFEIVPPLCFHPGAAMMSKIIDLSGGVFVVALQIGAPVIATLLFTNACFGLMSRLAPQMNIFFVALPIGIAVGLLVLGGTMPYFYSYLRKSFQIMGKDILILLKVM
ncbi:MAG: flagellar biosynthetic protein FliR [bacterium]